MSRKKIITIEKLFLVFYFLLTIGFLVFYSAKNTNLTTPRSEIAYIENWTVTDDRGEVFETGRTYRDGRKIENEYVIESVLPEFVSDNMVLLFRPCWYNKVYVNGELRSDVDMDRDSVIPGGAVKSIYITVPLTSEDKGATVQMVRKNATSIRPEIVPETMLTTTDGVYTYLFQKEGLSFYFATVLLIFSVIVMIVGLYMYYLYRTTIEMFYGAFSVMLVSIWAITNSSIYPFIFGHYHVDGLVNYLTCLLMPLGFLIYVDSIQKGRYRKKMIFLMAATTINAIFWPILHFCGIINFADALLYIDIALGCILLGASFIIFLEYKNHRTREYRYTAFGIGAFLFFCVIELITITFFTVKNDSIPMMVGLAILLIFAVMQQVDDLRREGVEKQKAIDMSEAKSNFLASMSHEIRTPINSILGMNEMIIRESKDEVITDYAKTVESSGRILLTLINDVLDFSKIEAGKMEMNYSEFSLSEVLSDVYSIVAERAQEKGLLFEIKIPKEVPDGQISDEYRIRQVLINYINNAIKYTDRGSVTLLVSGEYMENGKYRLNLYVRDTGRGIRESEKAGLFNAFSRADLITNRNIEGTGLGLAIVKSIADALGGEVGVDSRYGVGSEFYISIPVDITDKTPVDSDFYKKKKHTKEEKTVCDYIAPNASILVVDDNRSNLKIAELFLKRIEAKVDLCDGGAKAIALCNEKKYDLLLLDHMMPKPDGLDVLSAVRTNGDSLNKETPALVLTANAIAGSREKYLEAGFADYLAKPLDSQALEKAVKDNLPENKIIPVEHKEDEKIRENKVEGHMENRSSLKDRLASVEGMDYESALAHCASDEEFLVEMLDEIVAECNPKITAMEAGLAAKDYEAYGVLAHYIKGIMATVGFQELSDWAKAQDEATRTGNITVVLEEGHDFIEKYRSVCDSIKKALQ